MTSDPAENPVPFRERALNAEDLLCNLRALAKENPAGGFVVPRFLIGEVEQLIPDWRTRTARTLSRSHQAEVLAGGEPGYAASEGCPHCGGALREPPRRAEEYTEAVNCPSCGTEVPVAVPVDFVLWLAAKNS